MLIILVAELSCIIPRREPTNVARSRFPALFTRRVISEPIAQFLARNWKHENANLMTSLREVLFSSACGSWTCCHNSWCDCCRSLPTLICCGDCCGSFSGLTSSLESWPSQRIGCTESEALMLCCVTSIGPAGTRADECSSNSLEIEREAVCRCWWCCCE